MAIDKKIFLEGVYWFALNGFGYNASFQEFSSSSLAEAMLLEVEAQNKIFTIEAEEQVNDVVGITTNEPYKYVNFNDNGVRSVKFTHEDFKKALRDIICTSVNAGKATAEAAAETTELVSR